MRSFRADPANSHYPTRIHPALSSFFDECCGTLARLVAYVGALALLAIAGVHLWDQLPDAVVLEPTAQPGWTAASRAYPAFPVSQCDLAGKTETYEIFRHPEGGRKDVFRWSAEAEKPVAELEIYRPGPEFDRSGPSPAVRPAGLLAWASGSASTSRICGSPAGPARAARRRPGAWRSPAC